MNNNNIIVEKLRGNNEALNLTAENLGYEGGRTMDNNLLLNYIAENIGGGGGEGGVTPAQVKRLIEQNAYVKQTNTQILDGLVVLDNQTINSADIAKLHRLPEGGGGEGGNPFCQLVNSLDEISTPTEGKYVEVKGSQYIYEEGDILSVVVGDVNDFYFRVYWQDNDSTVELFVSPNECTIPTYGNKRNLDRSEEMFTLFQWFYGGKVGICLMGENNYQIVWHPSLTFERWERNEGSMINTERIEEMWGIIESPYYNDSVRYIYHNDEWFRTSLDLSENIQYDGEYLKKLFDYVNNKEYIVRYLTGYNTQEKVDITKMNKLYAWVSNNENYCKFSFVYCPYYYDRYQPSYNMLGVVLTRQEDGEIENNRFQLVYNRNVSTSLEVEGLVMLKKAEVNLYFNEETKDIRVAGYDFGGLYGDERPDYAVARKIYIQTEEGGNLTMGEFKRTFEDTDGTDGYFEYVFDFIWKGYHYYYYYKAQWYGELQLVKRYRQALETF